MLTKRGFGIVEVIVALGLFAVVGVTGVTLVLHSFTANRLGVEQTAASNLASSGIDIVRNIRTQSYSNLVNGTYGLKNTAGVWSLTATPETWDKFTRTITIADAQRDGSGNLVDSGTLDSNTKKVTSTVTWNVGALRNNSVIDTSYFTNFGKAITVVGDAILTWGDTTTTPKWNTYTNSSDTFGTNSNTVAGESAQNIVIKTSPTKTEAIAGYVSSAGTLHVLCYNGSSWSEDWSGTVGGTGTTRRFDVGYEKTSGDVIVVYSTNTATTNELAFRTKAGSASCGSGNWSSATSLDPVRTSGIVQWIKLAEDSRASQNILAMVWEDATSAISSLLWNGTSWVNEPTAALDTSLERVTAAGDTESFDLTFESTSGNLMVVWGRNTTTNNTNGVYYRRCTGGTATCTWDASSTLMPGAGNQDDATNLSLASNPSSNEIVFAAIGNQQSDLQASYWNGSAWTRAPNLDTSCTTPIAGSKKVATGWLKSGATTRSIVTYDDQGAGTVNWVVGNSGTFTVQTDFTPAPLFSTNQGWYQISQDPDNLDRFLFTLADGSNDLFSKRLVMTATPTFTWTNSNGAGALETNLSQRIAQPFSLFYWRN